MAYGTKIRDFATIEDAERHALDSAYFPQGGACGWVYRVEAVSYSYVIDADYEEYGSTGPELEIIAYRVRNWTQHGATLDGLYSGAKLKWVDLRPGGKQWASRTAREAVEQFLARRKRQMWVLSGQLDRAKYEAGLALTVLGKEV